MSSHLTEHRPWPIPNRPWSITMRWENLLFLHWPVDKERLQELLPKGLEMDTFEGRAWLGVVPFTMASNRFRWMPPVPQTHRFLECNLRTYVRCEGRPGVWFFSLDAASRLAVEGARIGYGLPYFHAEMTCDVKSDRIQYHSHRRDRRAPAARFEASWQPIGAPRLACPGTREHFLVERYCLYAMRRGHLVRQEIAHRPWQLSPVKLDLQVIDMTRLIDIPLVEEPVTMFSSQSVDALVWPPAVV